MSVGSGELSKRAQNSPVRCKAVRHNGLSGSTERCKTQDFKKVMLRNFQLASTVKNRIHFLSVS